MFGTEMHLVTFVILIFQSLVLFAQLLFVFGRPNDTSRRRFLFLIISYIIYNLFSGIFPDKNIPITIILQNILAYSGGIQVAIYFIYYIYKEFNIYPFKLFGVQSLLYTLVVSFLLLFVLPYYFVGSLKLSRRLFLAVPLLVAVAFFFQVSKALIKVYKNEGSGNTTHFKYRVIAGNLGLFTLSLMPVVVAIGDYQTIEQSIVNFGFIIMMATYIVALIAQAQQEAIVLAQIGKKENSPSYETSIAEEVIQNILKQLQEFEEKKDYTKGKVSLNILAKRFNTNSKYLSQIVNSNKGKPFTQYLNDLRIEYLKLRLEEDEKFRGYTIQAMATEIGYTSMDAFHNAFYKRENMKPYEYIKKFRDN